ncbi:hypothetical protein Taro_021839 [Colocasia esculenta]|uniref:Pentatricopeptide repeat-containing protein n=1 Tax=Colocasia esculenta TaxID=4460 RepID=A0A843V2A8_COLES|nr:hypothetical protein [Colocasia esculenta]
MGVRVASNALLSFFRSKSKLLLPTNPCPLLPALAARPLSSPPCPPPVPSTRTRTPLEKQFDSWIDRLRPGFSPADVDTALRAQADPDLALDIFRWASHRRGYRHTAAVYHTMLQIAVSGRRFHQAEGLLEEVLSGACPDPDLPLFNAMVRFCCSRKHLFSLAFDVFKKMQRSSCKPSIETYSMLLAALVGRFHQPNVSFVYLHAVRSLVRQMKASGVIPDTYALNLIIKAYSKCLEMEDAVRVYKEMGLYGCEPNEYTFGYLAKGLCEKGRIEQGVGFYREMRERGLVPTKSVYMVLVCSLSLERRFVEAIDVMRDMLGNSMVPDLLTYRTLLESLCREGKANEAFQLLEELRNADGSMDDRMYSNLLDGLHWLCQ